MRISVALSVSRRTRGFTGSNRDTAKELRLVAKSAAMFIKTNGNTVFKLINRK